MNSQNFTKCAMKTKQNKNQKDFYLGLFPAGLRTLSRGKV
jgi:hypothetical protein